MSMIEWNYGCFMEILIYIYGWIFVRPRRWFFKNLLWNHSLRLWPKKEGDYWCWPNLHWVVLYRLLWPFFKWLYYEAWRSFCKWENGFRSSYPWIARLIHWIGRTTVGNHISCVECWHCGFEVGNQVDLADDESGTTFILKDSGSFGTQDGTCYWFNGITICPICGYKSYYEDSN